MAEVRRTVVISAEQDAFLGDMSRRFGLNRSHAVRIALDKLMRDPPFFVTPNLANSKELAHNQQVPEGATR
jgi:hypothetical protein